MASVSCYTLQPGNHDALNLGALASDIIIFLNSQYCGTFNHDNQQPPAQWKNHPVETAKS